MKVEAGRVDLQFNLTATKEVSGRVVFQATGKPVTEFRLTRAIVAGPNGGTRPKPLIYGMRQLFFADADGRFTISVPPAVYEIEAITVDGQRSATQRVEVTGAGQPTALELAIRSAGTLWGTVKGEKGPAPQMVFLWDVSGEKARRLRLVTPDSDGRYEIRSVDAGTYVLEAYRNHPAERNVLEVELQAGAKNEVNLVLQRGVDVGVTVAGVDQRPIEGARVEIHRADGVPHAARLTRARISVQVFQEVMKAAGSPSAAQPFPFNEEMRKRNAEALRHLTVTNAEGKLAGWQLIPGDYLLEATADGYKPAKKSFRVEAGQKNEVVVVLQKAG